MLNYTWLRQIRSVRPMEVHVGKGKSTRLVAIRGNTASKFCVPQDCTSQFSLCVPRYWGYILILYTYTGMLNQGLCLSRAPGLNDFATGRRKSHKSSSIAATGIGSAMGAVCSDQKAGIASGGAQGKIDYSSISDDEWKKRLSKDQYNIARKKGTERAFTGEYWNTKTPGVYHCICCDTPLFDSSTKFDSGTGWPSYFEPIGNNVKSKMDFSIIFMPREEVLCAACDAHLGHVFDDGPPPTGKRYCINSASLKLRPR